MPVEHVLEVADLSDVAPVPRSRPEMLGVRNMRGQILPVVDLALLLGIHRTAPPGRLLVAEAGGRQAGFAIDEVSMVGELADPVEETESDLLVGATLVGGDLVGVIDVPRVFAALAGTGLAGTGLAGTGLAGTGLAGTGLAGTGLAGTGLEGTPPR